MKGINKVILLGNVGRAPETRHTAEGRPITTFSLATQRHWIDQNGDRHDETEWHRVITFGPLAKVCGQHLEKGRVLYLEGHLRTRQWSDQEGRNRWTTEILAEVIQFVGGAGTRRDAMASPILVSDLAPSMSTAQTEEATLAPAVLVA